MSSVYFFVHYNFINATKRSHNHGVWRSALFDCVYSAPGRHSLCPWEGSSLKQQAWWISLDITLSTEAGVNHCRQRDMGKACRTHPQDDVISACPLGHCSDFTASLRNGTKELAWNVTWLLRLKKDVNFTHLWHAGQFLPFIQVKSLSLIPKCSMLKNKGCNFKLECTSVPVVSLPFPPST